MWLAGITLLLACGNKDSGPVGPSITVVPASWGGIWSVRTTARACGTSQVLFDSVLVDTLCPGTPLRNVVGLPDSVCARGSLTATESRVSFSCTQSFHQSGCNG